ncbi:MAG: HD domain-containing protein [Candidatus Hodarchaeales archaeon]|jgi:(p)ppGpp synthase/HD superfamily hydrolase
MSDTLVIRAFAFSYEAHRETKRKLTNIPYITHPLSVIVNLMRSSIDNEELLAAALLHDVVEDEDVTIDQLKESFGERVASLVQAVSEPKSLTKCKTDRRKTWKHRKLHTIESMKSASHEVKLLSCSDKLANTTDMLRDIDQVGEEIWDRFNAPKESQKWYYTSLMEAYKLGEENIETTNLYKELKLNVEQLFQE